MFITYSTASSGILCHKATLAEAIDTGRRMGDGADDFLVVFEAIDCDGARIVDPMNAHRARQMLRRLGRAVWRGDNPLARGALN
jgi:hypothetical protein